MTKHVFRLVIFAAVLAMASQIAWAESASAILSRETFFARTFGNWEQLAELSLPQNDLKAGEIGFLAVNQLIRGQDEISVDNVLAKLDKKIKSGDITFAGASARLNHDGGRSAIPVDDPIEVVKGPLGYLILDGHHDVYLTLAVNGQTIAAEVKRDYSQLSVEEFWIKMRSEHAIYLRASNEELVQNPPQMTDVADNPNRYAASLIALKAKLENEQGEPTVRKLKGPKKPVWVKAGRGVPFIEFYIAKALTDAGFTYKPEWGTEIPDVEIERARAILLKAKRNSKFLQLRTLIVIESRKEAKELRNTKSLLDMRVRHEQQSERLVRCEMSFGA